MTSTSSCSAHSSPTGGSPTTTSRRVSGCRPRNARGGAPRWKRRVIASYHAQLSPDAIGLGVTVFVQVRLATHSPENSKRFVRLIDSLDEVQEAYALTGDADYMVKLTVPDLKALSHILNDVFLPHESVAHVHSSIVLDRLKQSARLPLAHLTKTPDGDTAKKKRAARSRRTAR
jgi:DNA-binding Lrp family transcriptional regulator